jgi:hypothetical protein
MSPCVYPSSEICLLWHISEAGYTRSRHHTAAKVEEVKVEEAKVEEAKEEKKKAAELPGKRHTHTSHV